jgi:hypothetical protein
MSTPENLNQPKQHSLELKSRKYALAFGITNGVIGYAVFVLSMWCFFTPQCVQFDLVTKHYVIFLGIPLVAMASISFLRSVDGPIKFKWIGFEFEGASGQIVMFVIVFLSFVLAILILRNV